MMSYFSFDGRIDRKTFLITSLICLVLAFIPNTLAGMMPDIAGFLMMLSLIPIWLQIAACVKRLRDIGKSPWWTLLFFLPIAALVLIIWLCIAESQGGTGRFRGDFTDL